MKDWGHSPKSIEASALAALRDKTLEERKRIERLLTELAGELGKVSPDVSFSVTGLTCEDLQYFANIVGRVALKVPLEASRRYWVRLSPVGNLEVCRFGDHWEGDRDKQVKHLTEEFLRDFEFRVRSWAGNGGRTMLDAISEPPASAVLQ